jgi:hypothetical protein
VNHSKESNHQAKASQRFPELTMNLSHEMKLLLACANTQVPEAASEEVKHIVSLPLDWEKFVTADFWHDIAPLVYFNTKNIPGIPENVIYQLEQAYYGNMARNMLIYEEINRVLRILREHNIEVIVLKGAALAESVYPDRALRPMGDVDLLLREDDIDEVESKLLEIGYLLHSYSKPKEFWKKDHYHFVLKKNKSTPLETTFEMHWHIEPPSRRFKIDIRGMWRRAIPAQQAAKIPRVGVLRPGNPPPGGFGQ